MRIFITGASGYIGRVVTEQAVKAGHQVFGLARSETAVNAVQASGGNPVFGDLKSVQLLERTAAESDVVLHLAFMHDWNTPYGEVLQADMKAVEVLEAGIRGTAKPLVITSGTAVTAPSPTGEETDEWAPTSDSFILKDRVKAERAGLSLANRGSHISALRLPPYVYGRGGSMIVPMLLRMAAERGVSAYIGDGLKRTSAVHVDDAARAYLLVAERAAAGSVVNCTSETAIPLRDLAEAIGEAAGVPAKSYSRSEVEGLWGPFLTSFVDHENRASSTRLRQLGWQPTVEHGLLDDIRQGSYRQMGQELQAASKH